MKIFYTEITSSNDIYFADAIKIYIDSFPSNERQPLPVIKKELKKASRNYMLVFTGTK